MKYTGKYVKKPKGKKSKRQNKRRLAIVPRNVVVAGQGFPKKMVMKHRYHETIDIVSNSGAIGSAVISANGMYDPNVGGAGHQPYYFDQMAALYNHFTVIGSKITVTFNQRSTGNTTATCAIHKNDDAAFGPLSMDTMIEMNSGKFKVLPAGGGYKTCTLTNSWSAKKMFGGSTMGNDQLRGNASTNPAEQTMYVITSQPTDILSTQTVVAEILVEYIAVWTELKDISGS